MIQLFKKKSEKTLPVDVHSHLLPGIDDGVKTIEESLQILKEFKGLGYKKIITTPHINPEFYPNTPEIINEKLNELKEAILNEGIDIEVEAAAEYYLGEELMQQVNNNEPLLTFGSKYLLFECSFLNEPFFLRDFIFKVISLGYKPVLAHPERYAFVQANFDILEDMKNRGVLLQLNISSLVGAYQPMARKLAEKMINKGIVDILGSDCHNIHHISYLHEALYNKSFKKAVELPLLNYQL